MADGTVIRFPERPTETDGGTAHPSGAHGPAARWPATGDEESYDWFAHSIVEACRGIDDASDRQWLLDALWRSRDGLFRLRREGDTVHPGLGHKLFETLVAILNDDLRRGGAAGTRQE